MRRIREHLGQEQRRYIRLDSVFPVQFRVLGQPENRFLSGWLQGFTSNIGKGGICLEINNLNPELSELISDPKVKLQLEIELPITRAPIIATAHAVWVKNISPQANKYLIGLAYERIDAIHNAKIMRYALAKRVFVPAVVTIITVLILALLINGFVNFQLVRRNKMLVNQLVTVTEESSLAKQELKKITDQRKSLEEKLIGLQGRIQGAEKEMQELSQKAKLEEKAKAEESKTEKKIKEYAAIIKKLNQEKIEFHQKLISLENKEKTASHELASLDKRRQSLEKANFDKMYQWLKVHQNPRTGLLMSFEGDADIAGWAFTYDQSLAIQVYTYFGDFPAAKKMLDFFDRKAKTSDGRFFNAYYADDGEPAEYTVHSGPNIWLAIAALQYAHKSRDNSYMSLAEEIGRSIIQNQDKEGGIRGGPDVEWYATEHNLDAYAMFDMLYRTTNRPEYQKARDRVLHWLIQHTYSGIEPPIKRGKGDSTIATDTYAWSIAAIGPAKLLEIGMDPDKIMEFAEQNCAVEIIYERPDGQNVKVKGFDFALKKHLGRGGVVTPEWTGQMIMSFRIMSDFYSKKGDTQKARLYADKANGYLLELTKMIISSPSPSGQGEGCLPYASLDSVDTGHGWSTPRGKSTGSVAGTAYTLFAYLDYNPLQLEE